MEIVSDGNLHLVRALNPSAKSSATARFTPTTTTTASNSRYGAQQIRPAGTMNAASSPLVHSQGHTSSNYSIRSQPSSRSSDTTQGTAHSTLFPPPPLPPLASAAAYMGGSGGGSSTGGGASPYGGNDVTATDNIMNSVADASSSLFQICVALRQRLLGVPGFDQALYEEEEEADDDTDPVTLLWRTFRRGYPLMLLYNALRPSQPLVLPQSVKEDKRGKAATFKFLQACMADLRFPQEELFIITDLYGDDTTGFVKVARVVNRVLDVLVSRQLIEDVRPTASDFEQAAKGIKRTQRQHIVSELVTTERTYVQHLEILQAFKRLVEEKGIIPGDAIHDIFLNLNALLDFQRRFLIRVEQTNAQPEEEQNWGRLFLLYCEAFKVYEPYIANQRKCEKTVVAEFSKLKDAGGSLEMRQMVESSTSLYGFLMKPFQRLSKYPLLLDDLYKKGDLDEARRQDLLNGKEAATAVLTRTNEAVDREEKVEAVQELKLRVEDWKGHRVEGFGQLMLYGSFTVLKSENLTSGKDGERQYHVYLFETILLCCKSIDLTKPKNRLAKGNLTDPRGKPKLQLKGRIFMQNVTDLVSLAKPGSYTCQIFWKGDPSIENFIIRFTTEDMMKKWAHQIESQRRKYRERSNTARTSDSSRTGVSATEFSYMQNQGALVNPYQTDIDEDDDEVDTSTLVGSNGGWSHVGYPQKSDFAQSRNGSSSSLRSRSTTGESSFQAPMSAASGRAPPPRFPQGSLSQPPLSLRTRELQQSAQSPSGDQQLDSYFSPVGESPMSAQLTSARTSASSNMMYPFPRQTLPQPSDYYQDGHGASRFTAPAMARPQPQTHGPSNGYAPPGRGPVQRPSYQAGSSMHSAQQLPTQARNRSASSPDIHNGPRAHSNGPQPPVPNLPASLQYSSHGINRSQNDSPNLNQGLPGRGSPQMQRERQYSRQEYSPTEYQGYAAQRRPDTRAEQYPSSRTVTPVSVRGPYSQPQPQQPQQQYQQPPPPPPASVPAPASAPSEMAPYDMATTGPAQLKVKVICPAADQTLTLVVPTSISYQSLKDRIDAKLQRSTNLSLTDRAPRESQVKLKFLDDDDFVSIQSDEDVQIAFETWREQYGSEAIAGMGEIELYCQR